MNVVIYARVSSAEQVGGYSIEAQIDECRSWSNQQGHSVVRVYVEPGRSARTDERPQFQRMIRNVVAGEAEAIVVHKADRFARNLLDLLQYKKLLKDAGAVVLSVTEPFLNSDRPEDQMVTRIVGAVAEFMALNVRSEASKGVMAKIRAGQYPGSSLPLGYIRVGEKREARIEVCRQYGPIIITAFQDFATGRFTIKQWYSEAKRRGHRSRNGAVISASRWQGIFRNRFYIGQFDWKGQTYHGDHPALIEVATWQVVQQLLEERNSGGKAERHFWLLKDLLWSEVHSKPMTGSLVKGRFAYYRAKGRTGLDPVEHNIRAEEAEAQVIRLLSTIRAGGQGVPAPDEWVLALVASPHLGLIYPHLATAEDCQAFLQMVFLRQGLYVNAAGMVRVVGLKPGFELIE